MTKILKTTAKIILGIITIVITPVIIFYLFDEGFNVNDFILMKWFPLLSSFLGFYIAGKINGNTRMAYVILLYPSLLIFILFKYFYFPFFFLILFFSSIGLLMTRKEINRRYKITSLSLSILLFSFYLFSQPLIVKQKGFGSDNSQNLYNATVLWDFTDNKPSTIPNELFEDENGNEIGLDEFEGKDIYITFWATWCGPCISEKPLLEKLKKDYSERNDLIFIDISIDQNKNKWKKYLNENKPNGIQLITTNEAKIRSNFQFTRTLNGIPVN